MTPWIAAALAVGVPLAFDPGGYFIFLPIKWTLAVVLVAAGLAALILERRPLAWARPLAMWVVLLFVLVAAAVFGVGGLTSWIGYPGRYLGVLAWVTFFAAFLLGASLREGGDRARVVRAAAAASILVSAYALLQAAGIDPIEWSEEIDVSRSRSSLGNAAFLGAYLALIVPLTGRLALSASEPPRVRALHATSALLGSIALVTTETRAAWLGAAAGLVVALVLERERLRAIPARLAAILAAGLLAIAVVVSAMVVDPGRETGRGRLIQWDRTLDLIAARPVLGWGPETYAFIFPRYIDAKFERRVARDVIPDRAHNVFLDIASAAGVFGVAAFLAILGFLAWAFARARETDALAVGLAGGCTAYLAQLQLSFPLADLDTVFWLFAGLLLASTGPEARVVSRRWAILPLAAALPFAVWGLGDLAADRTLRRSLDAEAAASFAEAQRLADRAADLAPGRAQYLQAAGRLHRRVGETTRRAEDFERGLDALDDARRLIPRDLELALDRADLFLSWGESAGDPRLIERAAAAYESVLAVDAASSRAHLRLGVAYVQLGRADDAEREWLRAASLSPRSAGPLLNLGLLYEQQGRNEEAGRTLREALERDPENSAARAALRRLRS